MMKAEFYGAKMNSFSPDSMKPFSTKFEDTLASDDVFQHTSPEFETTMNGHFRSQNIERILKYESIWSIKNEVSSLYAHTIIDLVKPI